MKPNKSTQDSGYKNSRHKGVWLGISILISAVCIYILILLIDPGSVQDSLATIDPIFFLLSVIVAGTVQAARAWRLSLLIGCRVSWHLGGLVVHHQFWANVLPFRVGEAALPLFLNRAYGVSVIQGGLYLLVLRLYDLVVLCMLGTASVCLLPVLSDSWKSLGWLPAYGPWTILFLATISVFGGLFFSLYPRWVKTSGQQQASRDPDRLVTQRLLQKITPLIETLTNAPHRQILFSSLLIWTLVIGAYWLAFLSAGVVITGLEAVLTGVAGAFAFALPINGLAGVGPFEAVVTVTLKHMAVPEAQALAAAVLAHIAVFMATGLQAASASLFLSRRHTEVNRL